MYVDEKFISRLCLIVFWRTSTFYLLELLQLSNLYLLILILVVAIVGLIFIWIFMCTHKLS
jgi:hypothetical protein